MIRSLTLISALALAATTGSPASGAAALMKGASAKTCPTDRSISRQINSMISPQAMITGAATNCEIVWMFALVRKFRFAISK